MVRVFAIKDAEVEVHFGIKGDSWKNSSTNSVSKSPSLGFVNRRQKLDKNVRLNLVRKSQVIRPLGHKQSRSD